MCGGYQSRTTDCTSHYIRESVLDEIVLRNLRQVTEFARERTEEFYAMATANGEDSAVRFHQARFHGYNARCNRLFGFGIHHT